MRIFPLRKNMKLTLLATVAFSIALMPLSARAQDDRTAGAAQQQQVIQNSSETYRQLNLFGDVFERVRLQYVDEVADKDLIENAINGMLVALDPHSSYLNEEDFNDMQIQTRGEFGGLGIEVTMENGIVKVVSPIDDTPAFRAGVQAGDYITHLDDEPIVGMNLNDAVDKMRGKVGTKIKITIRREGLADPLEVTITRDIIKISSVKHDVLDDSIGYIRITTFNQNTEEGLKNAVKDIKGKLGDKLLGYVLDLRNNPGGLLDQAIAVSDAFLDKGEIVSTRGRHEEDTKRDNATSGDITDNAPVVVLINGGSASAAEIVSGALQDHRRAIVLGTKSFGKGSVQTIIPLPGHGAMRLTTARYFTPSGHSIQAKGIEPDIVVEQAKLETIGGRGLRESDLHGALANPEGLGEKDVQNDKKKDKDKDKNKDTNKDKKEDPEKTPDKSSEAKDENQDYQLSRAKDLIRGVSLYGSRMTVPAKQ